MAENSKIEWTHHTFNPWRGCTKVSDGCSNCYADTMSVRNPSTLGVWGKHGTRVVASESMWRQPLKWDKAAAEAGERHRVFCASLADVFEGPETMPAASHGAIYQARLRLVAIINDTPNLDWLLLTKRPDNIAFVASQLYPATRIDLLSLPNVWLGVSIENRDTYIHRVPYLALTPGVVKFLSIEPLLGDLGDLMLDGLFEGVYQWVIVGGESGPNARPMHPDWVRSIRVQCQTADVPFFFKQWGEWVDANNLRALGNVRSPAYHDWSDGVRMFGMGKKQAGRLLDGREWNEIPEDNHA